VLLNVPWEQPQQDAPTQAAARQQQSDPAEHEHEEAWEAVSVAAGQLRSDPAGATAAEVLCRLLSNIVGSPGEAKYRRVRLSNPRIQAAVVEVGGGVELLLACGFDILFEEAVASGEAAEGAATSTEGCAVLPPAVGESQCMPSPSSLVAFGCIILWCEHLIARASPTHLHQYPHALQVCGADRGC
jgi:hypothetical protein